MVLAKESVEFYFFSFFLFCYRGCKKKKKNKPLLHWDYKNINSIDNSIDKWIFYGFVFYIPDFIYLENILAKEFIEYISLSSK